LARQVLIPSLSQSIRFHNIQIHALCRFTLFLMQLFIRFIALSAFVLLTITPFLNIN